MTRIFLGGHSFAAALLMGSTILGGAVLHATPAMAQGNNGGVNFNIPAQSLGQALMAFSQQTGVDIVYGATVPNVRSAGISGRISVAEALSQLLTGTGLTYRFTGAKSVTLEAAPVTTSAVRLGPVRVEAGGNASITATAADSPPPPYAGGQIARGGKLGLLGNRDVLETPFNQTSYTSELIENQQARTVGDVLDNDPSIRRAWPPSGFYEYFQIRGFNVNSNDFSFNGLYGMVPRYGGIPVDLAERVEVLKGPGALLSGISPNGVVGGAVNIVPKRAGDDPLTQLEAGIESDSLWHAHLDVGRRFGPDGAWGVRINARYSDGDTYIDGQSKRGNNTQSLALDYRGNRVRIALDAYRIEDRNRGGASMAVSIADNLTALPRAPSGHTNVSPWGSGDGRTEAAVLSGEFDIAGQITAYAKAGYRRYKYTGYLLSSVYNLQDNGDATAAILPFPYDTHGDSEEAGIRGNFFTGPIEHRLVLSGSRQADYVKVNYIFSTIQTNIYNPVSPVLPPYPSPTPLKDASLNFGSVALADTMSAFDNRLSLTLGLRRQSVKTYNYDQSTGAISSAYGKSAWTPMAGLVVRATPHLSFYGNYIQGLSPGQTVDNTYNNAGEIFPPYKTEQVETGAKLETGSIINTLSLFSIERPSTLADYGTAPLPTLRLNGEQRNRGIEWNIFGAITPRLRVLGGVTYTQGRLIKTQDGAQDGNAAPGAAPWATNLGLEWDTGLAGFTLTGRVITTSSQYLDNENRIKLPGWTRFDAGARYAASIAGRSVTFRANIQNLLDKDYWEGVNSPGTATLSAPRTFQFSAAVDF